MATSSESGRPRFPDERGVVIVVVAVAIVGLLAATALVFDLGYAWQERRQLVNATDAAALAAATAFAVGEDGCPQARTYALANDQDAFFAARWCILAESDRGGVVTIRAEKAVNYAFAPVIGNDGVTIEAETSAAYGPPSSVSGGVRPFGLCVDAMDTFPEWKLPLTQSTGVLRVTYGKEDHPSACNGEETVPGNWGILDFDGGSNPVGDTRKWLRDGYDGSVYAGTRLELCHREPEACIDGDPGAWSSSLRHELDVLVEDAVVFTLPIFDSAGGNGNNAYFHIVGFVRAKLHGYLATGPSARRYLDLEFLPGIVPGRAGAGRGIDTGLRAVSICAVEAASAC